MASGLASLVSGHIVRLAFAFGGWRFFLLLLPLWGFVVGFSLGTEAMRALFGDGTFATVTSWVVGFVIAVLFAVFSYLYYYIAIAVLAGTVGYALGASVWGLIGNEQGVIAFVIGLVVGVIFAAVALALNVPRYWLIDPHRPGGCSRCRRRLVHPDRQGPFLDNVTWWQVGPAAHQGQLVLPHRVGAESAPPGSSPSFVVPRWAPTRTSLSRPRTATADKGVRLHPSSCFLATGPDLARAATFGRKAEDRRTPTSPIHRRLDMRDHTGWAP